MSGQVVSKQPCRHPRVRRLPESSPVPVHSENTPPTLHRFASRHACIERACIYGKRSTSAQRPRLHTLTSRMVMTARQSGYVARPTIPTADQCLVEIDGENSGIGRIVVSASLQSYFCTYLTLMLRGGMHCAPVLRHAEGTNARIQDTCFGEAISSEAAWRLGPHTHQPLVHQKHHHLLPLRQRRRRSRACSLLRRSLRRAGR